MNDDVSYLNEIFMLLKKQPFGKSFLRDAIQSLFPTVKSPLNELKCDAYQRFVEWILESNLVSSYALTHNLSRKRGNKRK